MRARSASARLEGRVNRSPAAASLTAGRRSDYKGLRFPGAAPAFASGFWAVMVILDCSRCTLPGLLFDIFRIFSGFSAGPEPEVAFFPKSFIHSVQNIAAQNRYFAHCFLDIFDFYFWYLLIFRITEAILITADGDLPKAAARESWSSPSQPDHSDP
jgi:hypothetical protein